ncbi:HAD family hydrolase [Myroides sp. M-43]|uniref:HAD family hydrolase n=1 Tax=Myroides oncorhynchi TaxID=2893756 RepID=UPI001E4519B2|nr:HAD family hydrolase [Myroides oncorhynchi]MCC9041781.1 HAD family hydrolase [Myroides oncorhynchi]
MKNVIFDLDGTLWDSRSSIVNAWNQVFVRRGYELINADKLTPLIGLSQKDIIRSLYKLSDKEINDLQRELSSEELLYLRKYGGVLYQDVEKCLNTLKKDYNLFIVSNCQDGYIEVFLEYYQLQNLFQDFESAGRTKMEKSENIRQVINRNNITDTVFYVGDTEYDLISARKNNIPFIFVDYGFGNTQDYDFVIKEFKELPVLLDSL